MYQKEYDTIQFNSQGFGAATFVAAVEETIELYVNNTLIASILASPEQLEPLAVGYLMCEGIIDTLEVIKDIRVEQDSRIFTEISTNEHFELWFELRSSGCIGVNWKKNEEVMVDSPASFDPDVVRSSMHYLKSDIYQVTRGTHAACVIDKEGNCVTSAVDVGRHNAVDKAIGQALISGFEPDSHFILSTGRQPAGMVLKAARIGIPMVVTKTAPLNSGIEAARDTGICLVGFAAHDSLTVFSNTWRLHQ